MSYRKIELTLQQFERNIKSLEKLSLQVGIPKEVSVKADNKRSGVKFVADKAFENNFGSFSKRIPARPFGSTLIKRYKTNIDNVITLELGKYFLRRQSLNAALNKIGIRFVGYMKNNLLFGNWKQNKPITIANKGSSKPLVDTGQMVSSITYIIKKNE